ncbi:hypothetical protein AKJ16_DCAP19770, partial [Drosera capensis]
MIVSKIVLICSLVNASAVKAVRCTWRLLGWAWLMPELLQRQQGLKGKSYRLLLNSHASCLAGVTE